jgi:hypothetical protein
MFSRLMWSGIVLVACIAMTIGLFFGFGSRLQARTEAAMTCSQTAVVAAERGSPLLNPDGAKIALPQGEPQIVATVDGHAITAARLEMMVQNASYTNQEVLARLGSQAPSTLKAELTRSSGTLRQMFLTKLIDNALWLSLGQHDGEYASVAAAHQMLKQSVAIFHSTSVDDPAHIQFEAFLCVNHLTEASYQVDPTVVQGVQNALTIAAAKAHVNSTLPPSIQHNNAAIQAADNAYIQSLWSKNEVQIFLADFVPTRA